MNEFENCHCVEADCARRTTKKCAFNPSVLQRGAELFTLILALLIQLAFPICGFGVTDETEIFPFGSTWTWLHPLNGQDPEITEPGFQANWMKSSHADLPNTGAGILGYGVLDWGPYTTNIGTPPSGQRYTAYLKRRFTVTSNLSGVFLVDLLCDDGCVIYIDGVRVGEFNYSGADTYTGPAIAPADETRESWVPLNIPGGGLTTGTHTIAVSLHNVQSTSSDLAFDMALKFAPTLHGPVTVFPQNGHQYQMRISPLPISWSQAKAEAESLGGHLATVVNIGENNFLYDLSVANRFWVRTKFQATGPIFYGGSWLGGHQSAVATNPSDGWSWVDGSPWSFTNWRAGEPNDAGGQIQDSLNFFHVGEFTATWDDKVDGSGTGSFIVEWDMVPVISSVSPNPVTGINRQQTFVINGTGFDPDCTVTLRDLTTGETFSNRPKLTQTTTSITLNPIFGTPAHTWSVEVINPGAMSSGQFTFSVTAPIAAPQITGLGNRVLAASSASQTVELIGLNLVPGSQIEIRSLDRNFSTVLTASAVNPTQAFFDFLFDQVGSWTVKLIAPNGEPTQPQQLQIAADSSGFHLSFPLKEGGRFGGGTPFNTRISSVLDHEPGPGITTFDGERFTIADPNVPTPPNDSNYRHPTGHYVLQGVAAYEPTSSASYNGHHGYDYLGTQGADFLGGIDSVYAAGSGTIDLFADEQGDGGNYVRITHANTGYKTYYFHLRSFASGFTPGKSQSVREGEFIGMVGRTGRLSTGVHLHFEVRRKKSDGTFTVVEPYGWHPNPGTNTTDPIKDASLSTSTLWRSQEYPLVDASPESFSGVAASGAVLPVTIHASPQNYQATVADGGSWLTILTGETGTGTATLTLAASTNTGSARSGSVIVAIPIGGPIEIRVQQAAGAPGVNPAPAEVATLMKALARQYEIPTPILAAMAWRNSEWKQFDASQQPLSWPGGEVGMMRVHPGNSLLPAGADATRLEQEWFYNLEMACHILRAHWKGRLNIRLNPWADSLDSDPRVVENWFIPVARYYGGGSAGYIAAGQAWDTIKSLPAPVDTYFTPITNLGDPRSLSGFPTSIANTLPSSNLPLAEVSTLISNGLYTLKILRRAEAVLHRWDWDANSASAPLLQSAFAAAAPPPPGNPESPVDITESIGSEPSRLTFAQWAAALGIEEINDGFSDGDRDGNADLIECALGGDPGDPNSKPVPVVSRNGGNLEVVAKVAKNITGLVLGVESSTDCLLWTLANVAPQILSEDTVSQTRKWVVPTSGSTQFIRLRVTVPE